MSKQVLCPECRQLTGFSVSRCSDTFDIRGEQVVVECDFAACDTCGERLGIAAIDDAAYQAAYAVYRARHNMLQPEQIRSLRSKYGLGQKAFARLLGWGDVTLARYEAGSLQSDSHNVALRLAEDPTNVRRLLAQNRSRLTSSQVTELETRLDRLSVEHESILAREEAAAYCAGPSVLKLREMVVYFAGQPKTWRTKLNKLLFYADFLHFKRYGIAISGARYVNMQYGPVPADFYTLQATLVDDSSVDETESTAGDHSGTIFVANRPADLALFSQSELKTLADVAEAFRGWSAKRIMEYSHSEPAWQCTSDRETIDYKYAGELRLS